MTQIPDSIRRLAVELGLRPGTRREGEPDDQRGELESQAARRRMLERNKRPTAGGDHDQEKGR